MGLHFKTGLYVFLSALIPFSASEANEVNPPPFRLCYFSLNNENEFKVMGDFVSKLNATSTRKIEVTEYHDPDRNPEPQRSFEKMVEQMSAAKTACDGLVISGHHTGAFGGVRTRGRGKLSLEFLEKLACNPKYRRWFESVKSLWLQGCRTIGPGKIEALNDPQYSADFHTQRVGAVLREDHLTQSFAALNLEFSATLDQDNPLSSRYLRTFPAATVFGWTKSAPGKGAYSEYSIPYHIAHIVQLTNDRREIFDNPVGQEFSAETAVKFTNALEVLFRAPGTARPCEDIAVQAWLDHGRGEEYVLNNPDLNAFKSLIGTDNSQLLEAKLNDCIFKNENKPKRVLKALDRILQDPVSIGYSFNSIFEALLDLQQTSSRKAKKLLNDVQEKLRTSAHLQDYLNKKLLSQQLGLIRKIDYYAFYRIMVGHTEQKVETLIRSIAQEQLLNQSSGASYHDIRSYKETLFESLDKHRLINNEMTRALAESPKSDDLVLDHALSYAQRDEELYKELVTTIAKAPAVTDEILAKILSTPPEVQISDRVYKNEKWMKLILDSPKFGPKAFGGIARLASRSIKDEAFLKNAAGDRIKKILQTHDQQTLDLSPALVAIIDRPSTLPGSKEIIDWYFKKKELNGWELTSLAEALALDTQDTRKPERLHLLISSPRANSIVLGAVCKTVALIGSELPDPDSLLTNVVRSPKATLDTLYSATKAVFALPVSPQRKSVLLHEIAVQARNVAQYHASGTGGSLRHAFREGFKNSADPIPGSKELFQSIIAW
ncbi:MAG TPA: hypothetical protein DCS07_02170 [Bdellovibrionales bacterium]|nr:MAG: hypothetical protein A2X97_13990 [Bdellovibrionales bacterium GWA1_52_35]OFZ40935.1 MAG: hypothetical protein A2070_06755 [Bdellovibrionales bacterium GWC1_52_8]HAR41431.1 hypothetical protein [Bdellovibrionales bacterium]HCM39912.1 hypothetical protein [Bdellovibrionales bacterium]